MLVLFKDNALRRGKAYKKDAYPVSPVLKLYIGAFELPFVNLPMG